jgi:DNA gyrase subunit A
MLISDQGTLVRTRASEVSTVGRNTQGVRLIRTAEDETVVGLQRIDEIEDDGVELDEDGNPIVVETADVAEDATDAEGTATPDDAPDAE